MSQLGSLDEYFDDEIPNMRTTVFESLLSSCCATKGYIELVLCGISHIVDVYVSSEKFSM